MWSLLDPPYSDGNDFVVFDPAVNVELDAITSSESLVLIGRVYPRPVAENVRLTIFSMDETVTIPEPCY
jgi:hypothetical protein